MLYKYLPRQRVDVIKNLLIRFTPLTSLNDPFEALPLIGTTLGQKNLISYVESGLDELWLNAEEHEKTEENKMLLDKSRENLLTNIYKTTCPGNVGLELISLLGDNFGVLSLSRTENSLLMWSHYASMNTGYVLAFNEDHDFFRKKDKNGNITRPLPVVYSGKRRKVIVGEENFYQKLVCEKPLEWAYEEEERVFRTFFNRDGTFEKDEHGNDIILYDLPADTIAGVFIGHKATSETEKEILEAIEIHGITCPVYKSRINETEYKLMFDLIRIT